jgi:hypothetical protein
VVASAREALLLRRQTTGQTIVTDHSHINEYMNELF